MNRFNCRFAPLSLLLVLIFSLLAACAAPQATQALINVQISVDGEERSVQLPSGSTVQQALESAGVQVNALDRLEPAPYAVLSDGAAIRLVRVSEKFEIEQEIIPFEMQTLRNESLAQDKEILLQRGENGLREITYRRVYEDGIEVSTQPLPVKAVIVKDPQPEIRMIGIQAPFAPFDIPGRLYYLRDGSLWMIEGTTADRRAVITAGDLDGRVLSLSSDGSWLLFTRRGASAEQINNLWAARLTAEDGSLLTGPVDPDSFINLGIDNVIHFADWIPGSNEKIVFSTVEPRSTAPGWQANNDLNSITFSNTGWSTDWTVIIEPNAGGVYGWWGQNYSWGPDNLHLTFNRPDGIGLVNYKTGVITKTLDVVPLQTRGDWAWAPGISWGQDGKVLYTVTHIPPVGAAAPESSQIFDLTAFSLQGGPLIHMVSQVGMFAYPLASPQQILSAGESGYQVAYLQAIFPNQSETSRYRLVIMDRDGSNQRTLFPPEGAAGLEPQQDWGAWSPAPLSDGQAYALAVLYQGNLWLVNTTSGEALQVTGDGLTSRVIWK